MRASTHYTTLVLLAVAVNLCGCGSRSGDSPANAHDPELKREAEEFETSVVRGRIFIIENVACSVDLPEFLEKRNQERLPVWRKQAQQGAPIAQYFYGLCLEYGVGVAKDVPEAVKWFRKAAEQDYTLAQYNLAVCLRDGIGTPADMVEATEWFRKAADRGDATAQHSLALCYTNGRGVPKNDEEAAKWYQKAAAQGNPDAQSRLRQLLGR